MWLGWRKRPPRKSESGSDGGVSIKRVTLKPARRIADTASYRGGGFGNERHLGGYEEAGVAKLDEYDGENGIILEGML